MRAARAEGYHILALALFAPALLAEPQLLAAARAVPRLAWGNPKQPGYPTAARRAQGYHILALALFAPALLAEPQLLAVALAVAAALLAAVEVARVGNVPGVGPRVHAFMTAFLDSRDAGAVLVSHFSLLAGAQPQLPAMGMMVRVGLGMVVSPGRCSAGAMVSA